jgi:hypothetical protein
MNHKISDVLFMKLLIFIYIVMRKNKSWQILFSFYRNMLSSSTLKMEAACSSIVLAFTCKTTVSYNPEHYNPNTYHRGNLRSHNEIFITSFHPLQHLHPHASDITSC